MSGAAPTQQRDLNIVESGGLLTEVGRNLMRAAASTEAVAVALRVDPAVVRPGAYDVVFHIEAVDDPGVSTNEKSRFFVR